MGVETPLGESLRRICLEAEHIVLAAPYIKADALSRVVGEVSGDASLTCITRWQVEDIATGVSDLECYSIIRAIGGVFRLHPNLHAKYFHADEHILIGSANVTNTALGWATEPNVEILCSPGPDFDAVTFEAMLVEGSREIGNREFSRWQSIQATISQDERNEFSKHSWSHLNSWRPMTRDPADLLLAYRGLDEVIASSDELNAAKRDLDVLQLAHGLTGQDVENRISIAFLNTPFVQDVLKSQDADVTSISRSLAERYTLSVTDARRGIEAVRNWFAFFLSD